MLGGCDRWILFQMLRSFRRDQSVILFLEWSIGVLNSGVWLCQ